MSLDNVRVAFKNKKMSRRDFLRYGGLLFASIFGIAAVYKQLESHAQSLVTASEAENGTLSGRASRISSSSASGGAAVQFGQSALSPVGNPSGGPWTLAWHEEFDSPVSGPLTMVPDTAVWADHLVYGDSARWQFGGSQWSSRNKAGLSVANSVLSIICRHENPLSPASVGYDPTCPGTDPAGNTLAYTSSIINSRPGFSYTYGYIESRIQIPTGTASSSGWPAFWLDCPNGIWNSGPEIDVQEFYEGGTSVTYWSGGSGNPINDVQENSGDLSQWHVYGMRWSPTDITFFVDGVQHATTSTAITDWPMFVYLGFQVRPPAGSGTGYPADYNIDYVRCWTVDGVPDQPVITSISQSSGLPDSSGKLSVSFNTVSGATSYRATASPIDCLADGWPIAKLGNGEWYGYGFATGSSSPLTITGLTPGIRYYVTVSAINSTGYSIESLPVPKI